MNTKKWWALVLAWVGFLVDLPAAETMAGPGTGTPGQFFGVTNLYTFHLVIAPDQWAAMAEPDPEKGLPPEGPNNGPGRPAGSPPPGSAGSESGPGPDFGRGRGPGSGPGPGPGPGGPRMGGEFQKGAVTLEFQGQPFGEIRVRFKGHSSFRYAANSLKRSFKLDFNGVEKGRTFFGLTKLNLNNNAMDPSQMRETLAYHVFRAGGVPAGRTALARVYLTVPGLHDHAYAGLYTAVEQVDERFLKDRFGSKDGLLLKPEQLAGLPDFGNDWAAYTNRVLPKTTVTAGDANRFLEFMKCIHLPDEVAFQAAIADFVEVDEYLRFLALECLLSNLDSPLMTGHNYYLHLHPKTRKFSWLPWDLNEAFGGFGPAGSPGDQMDLSLSRAFSRADRLTGRLLLAPAIRQRYQQTVRDLLDQHFNASRLFPLIDALAAVIRPALTNDPMVSLAQFDAALSETQPAAPASASVGQTGLRSAGPGGPGGSGGPGGPGGPRQPRPALKAFISQRAASVRLQLEGKADGYVPREMRPGPNRGPRPAPEKP